MSDKVGFAFETLTVSSKISLLSPSLYRDSSASEGAKSAFLTLYGGDIRYRYDGSSPYSLEGHVLRDGGTLKLQGQQQIADFKFIQKGKNPGEVAVTYER